MDLVSTLRVTFAAPVQRMLSVDLRLTRIVEFLWT